MSHILVLDEFEQPAQSVLVAHCATAILIIMPHVKTKSRQILKSGNARYQAYMYALGNRLFCAAAATSQERYKVLLALGQSC